MAMTLPPPMKRTSVRSSIEVDIAILYAVKHLRNIKSIHARSRTDYHLMIRRLARFETRGLLTKLDTRYELTEKGERYQREYAEYQRLKEDPTAEKATLEARRTTLRRLLHGS